MTDVPARVCDDPTRAEFDTRAIEQSFEIYVVPELARRQRTDDPRSITRFLVEIEASGSHRVLLGDEAEPMLTVYIKREDDGLQYFDEVHPSEDAIHPDSAWVCYFGEPGSGGVLGFDYRKNRSQVEALIAKAEQFLTGARLLGEANVSAAIDNAHSAAELSVQALMALDNDTTQNHTERRKWLKMWTTNGNSPGAHSDLLDNLADLRKAARYGAGNPPMKKGRFHSVCATIQEMIEVAKTMNGSTAVPITRTLVLQSSTQLAESVAVEDPSQHPITKQSDPVEPDSKAAGSS